MRDLREEPPAPSPPTSSKRTRVFDRLVLATFVLGALLRAPTFGRPLLSDDEAIYATVADAMVRGDRLYRDVVDHKPPLIYHLYQAGFAAFGRYHTQGAHALVVLAVLLTAGFLFAIVRRTEPAGGPAARAASLAAAALFLIFSTTWHDYDALAANCELFVLPFLATAAWLLSRPAGRPPPGPLTHVAVGALVGTATLFKYQGLTFLGASLGLLVWWMLLGRITWSRAVTMALCQTAGVIVPGALYFAWCATAGNAAALLYWFQFNFSYVGAGLTGVPALARGLRRTFFIGGVALVPYALGISSAVTTVRGIVCTARRREADAASAAGPCDSEVIAATPSSTAVLGVLWLATSALAVTAGGRFFGHYFLLILAPLCLLAASAFARLWTMHRSYRLALVLLCAVPAVVFFVLATVGGPLAAALDEGEPPYEDVARRIAALTTADERIFVWGNSPQLYILARRPMGARFSFCNYMTGESPGTPTETGERNADANQLPASWDMLFSDLERRRPVLFVDAAAAGWDGYHRYPLSRYPRLRAYVDQHYRPVEVRAGVVLYRRLPVEPRERTR